MLCRCILTFRIQVFLTKAPGGISKYFSVKLVPSGSDSAITMTVYKIKDNSARYYIELDGTPIGLCEKDRRRQGLQQH